MQRSQRCLKVGWEILQGCQLTVDNLYNSVPLAEDLLQKKMTSLGTMRVNQKGLTREIKETKNLEENSTIVVWRGKETCSDQSI